MTRPDRWLLGLIALMAAAPSLVRAATSPLPIADDWSFIEQARHGGLSSFAHGADAHARPLQMLLHWLAYTVFGGHLWLHLVVLALLNAAIAVLVVRIGRTWLPGRLPLAVAGIWAVLPNHSAIRLWPATLPTLVALVLLLVAVDIGGRDPARFVLPVVLIALSALTYEGGIAIGAAALVVQGIRSRRRREVVVSLLAVGLVAAWIWHESPKQALPKGPFQPGHVLAAELGSALVPAGFAALLLLAVLGAFVLTIAPGFRRPHDARFFAAGAALLILGVAPFVAARFPLSTDGLLDRGNAFASLGTALLLTATGRVLLPAARALQPAVLVMACALWSLANSSDVRAAHRADEDARRVLVALHHLDDLPPHTRLVLAPLPNHEGYSSFGYGSIAAAARHELGHRLQISDSLTVGEWRNASGLHVRLRGNRFVTD